MPQGSLTSLPTSSDVVTRATHRLKEQLTVQFGRTAKKFDIEIDTKSITFGFNDHIIIANAVSEKFDKFDLCDFEKGIPIGLVYLNCQDMPPTTGDLEPMQPGFYVVYVKRTMAELRDSTGKVVRSDLPAQIAPGAIINGNLRSSGVSIEKEVNVSYFASNIEVGIILKVFGPRGNG